MKSKKQTLLPFSNSVFSYSPAKVSHIIEKKPAPKSMYYMTFWENTKLGSEKRSVIVRNWGWKGCIEYEEARGTLGSCGSVPYHGYSDSRTMVCELYLYKHNFKNHVCTSAMDDQSDLTWKKSLELVAFLPTLNMCWLGGHNLIISTLFFSHQCWIKIRRHMLECPFPCERSSMQVSLLSSPELGPLGFWHCPVPSALTTGYLFQVYIWQVKWALAKWQISSYMAQRAGGKQNKKSLRAPSSYRH